MNMEAGFGDRLDFEEEARALRRRRIILVAAIAAVVVAVAMFIMLRRHGETKSAADTAPSVTVVVPRRQAVTATVAATGNIAARRDMPIGVAGEGGVVRQVFVEPGDWVKQGQVLATIDRSVQTQQASALAASIDQARADAALARSTLERAKKLVSNGFVSKADIESKQAALDSANARVAVAQAQLAQQRALIGRLDIRAPASGLVLTRSVEAGQIVGGANGGLFRVAENGAMEVRASLAEADLARLRVGAEATVTPVGTALRLVGHIWQISPVIDPNTRQGMVRVAMPFNAALRPGGFASVSLGGRDAQVPLLPESAVLSDASGNFVYIVGNDNRVTRRAVKVGDVDDRGVSVVGGLEGGEHVIASAGAFLNPGDKVSPTIAKIR